MRTRIATVSDENRVSELLLASYTELMARDYEPGVLAASLPKMVRANTSLLGSGTFYIVDGPNSTAIGCGGWTLAAPGSGMETAGVANLRHFATHPGFTRQGIGRLIFSRCVEAARLAGVTISRLTPVSRPWRFIPALDCNTSVTSTFSWEMASLYPRH
jgi:GNAT superfamily N-acetyltransferase